MDNKIEEPAFPTKGILPKEETQASLFLSKYPEYDGRGVVIAIFDTGVDPGAPGLQMTTDGKPKVIDIIDCSGSGDVDTSTVREAADGVLLGLTGRKLQLGKWDNPSGKYHVGIKRVFELHPRSLTPRIKKERKEVFDPKQREVVNSLQREIVEWKKTENGPSKKDLEARLEVLTGLSYEDPGPVCDIVVFQDSKGIWRAVIDTKENGDLTDAKTLADYRLEREYITFSDQDLLNISVNIYNDGNICCLCVDAGAHGTHVAGIVSAYFPDQPELNGIAPGAQIVAIKIGDSRLGTMETGTSLVRALIACKQAKCDLINMSYGEPVSRSDIGRFVELASEMVTKYKTIFVASAGNNGPALTTVGAPGGTTSHLIGVGALVSPQMMSIEYSLREQLKEMHFTWSSRGPTEDGALGVSISAPGGAISPVPNWTLKKNQQMNGTSMSSPNACGNIALVLSGLKALKVNYYPHSIKRAVENTANFGFGRDHLTQGYGCIQALAAFEYAKKYTNESEIRMDLKLSEGRGVYLREQSDLTSPKEYTLTVEPFFPENTKNQEKIKLEKRILIRSTVTWVKTPEHLLLSNEQRSFKIIVDPLELPEGPHYGEVQCFDSNALESGPIMRLPCTVMKPSLCTDSEHSKIYENLKYTPGLIRRYFFSVPHGATWAKTTIKACEVNPKRLFVYQRVLIVPHQSLKTISDDQYLWLQGDDTFTDRFEVSEGHTLEICVAQYWSSLGDSGVLSFGIEFHGISHEVQGSTLQLTPGENFSLKLRTPFRSEKIQPKAVLAVIKKRIPPSSSTMIPLHPVRDCLPDGRQIYSCVNVYNFNISDSATVIPRLVGFDQLLYDSPHESQFWMVFDENKQLLQCGDFQPEAFSISKKGKYTVRVQFRHDNLDILKQVKNFPLLLERHLSKDKQISLTVYPSLQDALVSGTKFPSKAKTLLKGQSCIVSVSPPAESKLPKDLEPGDILSGYIIFRNLEEGESVPDSVPKKGLVKPLGGIFLEYSVPSSSTSSKKLSTPSFIIDEGKSAQDNYQQALQQHAADYVSFLVSKKKLDHAQFLLEESLKKYPTFLPLLRANLGYHVKVAETKGNYGAVIAAADLVLSQINADELAKFYGLKHEESENNQVKLNDKLRDALTATIQSKAEALLELFKRTQGVEDKDLFLLTVGELNKWNKITEAPLKLQVAQEKLKGNLGGALKILKKRLESSNDKDATELMLEIFEELGWHHWVENKKTWLLIQFPNDYVPF